MIRRMYSLAPRCNACYDEVQLSTSANDAVIPYLLYHDIRRFAMAVDQLVDYGVDLLTCVRRYY
jgi:hypothetical protein